MASCNEKRTSRKHTFAEEESWFLVQFEDQPDAFRVLNEREVKHLDPEDHEEMQEGETIQAFWSADKKFYEAEIVKISDDKNYLLKERRALETSLRKSAVGKALASDDQPGKKRFKKAQKQPSVSKKVKVTQEAKKAKEADKLNAEKKRKAELAAKLAQATKRISSQKQQSSGSLTHPSTEIRLEGNNIHTLSLPAFREQQNPLSQIQAHQLASGLHNQENNNSHPLTLPAFRRQLSPSTVDPASTSNKKQPVNRKQLQPQANSSYSDHQHSDHELISDHQGDDNIDLPPPTPAADPVTSRKKQNGKRKKKKAQQPTIATSLSTPSTCSDKSTHVLSDDEDDGDENTVITTTCDNMDCKALLLENKTLKDKVKKLQRRLDTAVKAKSPTSIMAGKPAAGIIDRKLAAEYQMKEFFDGSGIYWYSSQRSICSACTKWEEYVNLVVDIFFSKEVLRMSCARGLNKGRKLKETVPLCQPIVEAIIGKVCARFQPPPTVAQITGKINQKCTEARRPKRVALMAIN